MMLSAVPRLPIAYERYPCTPWARPPCVAVGSLHVRVHMPLRRKKAPPNLSTRAETAQGRLTKYKQVAPAEAFTYASRCHKEIPCGSAAGDESPSKRCRQPL